MSVGAPLPTRDDLFVAVLVPVLNEMAHVEEAARSLIEQKEVPGELRLFFSDGGSTDGTWARLMKLREEWPDTIELMRNADGSTPAGLNQLVRAARERGATHYVRADAHSVYPPNYVAELVAHLERTGAANVGGVIESIAPPSDASAAVVATALRSRFGVGRSFRTLRGHEPVRVETVPFGSWVAGHFERYGPFDERFERAQDLEHNVRVQRAGGTILCLPWVRVRYHARSRMRDVFFYGYRYGYWKIPVLRKHGLGFSLRQFFPPAVVLVLAVALTLGWVAPLTALPAAVYLATSAAVAAVLASRELSLRYAPHLFATFLAIHVGYGCGYLRGLLDVWVLRRRRFTGPGTGHRVTH